MSWVVLGASVVSAGAGIHGSQQAANAQGDAAKKNAELQRQNMMMQLGIIEPQRQLGYGAQSDLATLYGYNLSPYQTGNQLMTGGASGGNGMPIQVDGRNSSNNSLATPFGKGFFDPLGFGGDKKIFGGTINPLTGTVDITNGNGKKAQELEAQLTNYLRTGQGTFGGKAKRFVKQIDQLRANGYQYDPNAKAAADAYSPAAQGGGNGQAGNMSRFFTSPDYQFRRDEGQRDIGNSFAARGGAASGNALRALSEFNGNLASGEFNNYTNRLLSMAGLGQVANGQAAQAGQNYTNGVSQTNQQQSDARASGILGTTNGISNLIGDFAGAWGARQRTQQPAQNSLYGPYAGGYRGANLPQQQQSWNYIDSLGWRG